MNNVNQDFEVLNSKIRFRCPNCSKLYVSDPNNIFVEEPEFKCTSCKTDFSISLLEALNTDQVVGKKLHPQKRPELFFEEESFEEKDDKKTNKTSQDIAYEGWNRDQSYLSDFSFSEPESKKENLWNEVLEDYENSKKHNEFIRFCTKNNEIDFAKDKYNKILKVNPFDEMSSRCFNMICVKEDTEALLERDSRIKQNKWPIFTIAAVIIGATMMLLGIMAEPDYPNVTGLGFGIVVFSLALKALFQKKETY